MGRENGQGAVDEYNYKKIVQRRFKNNGKTQPILELKIMTFGYFRHYGST